MVDYRQGLAAALTETALPYGYTLTVWSSGELLRRAHPPPGLTAIFLFILGAAAGYGALRVAVGDAAEHRGGMGRHRIIRAGAVHLAAIAGAAGVAAALAAVPGLLVWPLAPLGSTVTYLGTVALEQAIEVRRR